MSSTIQVYTNRVYVENQDVKPDMVVKENGTEIRTVRPLGLLVTLENVDASDIVSEFFTDEILDALDYSDIMDYVQKNELS
jgi:hypothetical protein